MIVDFHTHVFPDKIAASAIATLEGRAHIKAYTAGTETALYASMSDENKSEQHGASNDSKSAAQHKPCVDISIVLPVVTNPLKTTHFNDFAEQMNARYAEKTPRIISFAGVHPDTPDMPAVIKDIAARGFKGIKLHPDYQNVCFDDIRYERIVAEAEKYNLITVVHAGIDIGLPEPVHCTPKMARRVIDDVHPKQLVLAHMGGWKLWDDVEELLVGQQVYFDTAFTDTYISQEQFVRMVKNHGVEKILFGTDSPWSGQKETIAMIQKLPLTADEKEKILGGNAVRLLKLC
jgi:predicted TIM-barrel fold metal-dependent hydrolase